MIFSETGEVRDGFFVIRSALEFKDMVGDLWHQERSFFRISLARSLGSALPRVFFMTWPMR